MEIVITHFGIKQRIEDSDAALDVRIVEALEEIRLHTPLPTVAELKVRCANPIPIDKFRARVQWLAEQDIVEVSPTGRTDSFRVRLTEKGKERAREFEAAGRVQG